MGTPQDRRGEVQWLWVVPQFCCGQVDTREGKRGWYLDGPGTGHRLRSGLATGVCGVMVSFGSSRRSHPRSHSKNQQGVYLQEEHRGTIIAGTAKPKTASKLSQA